MIDRVVHPAAAARTALAPATRFYGRLASPKAASSRRRSSGITVAVIPAVDPGASAARLHQKMPWMGRPTNLPILNTLARR